MKRRLLLKAAALPVAALAPLGDVWSAAVRTTGASARVRPGQPGWPTAARWQGLRQAVGGRLVQLGAPFAACAPTPIAQACSEALAQLTNSFAIGDQPALTQTSGWLDGWTARPSAYAVAASNTADVVAAVNFARTHHLRLVVKGGGHSYQGTSDAPDSLLVWTRRMNEVQLHEAFVARGCRPPCSAHSNKRRW